YGPDMGWEHVIPQLAMKANDLSRGSGETVHLPIQGNGQETRAFLHIDDAVGGIQRIIERGEHLGVYHLGTDQETTIEELAKQIGHAMGCNVVIVPGALQPGGTLRRCPDITKLRTLGFEPVVSLEQGLPSTVSWYCQHAARRPSPEKELAHVRHAA